MNADAAVRALNLANLRTIDARRVTAPSYDPSEIGIGVVHIGLGAFHRAHQAEYFDRLLAADPRWGICAASLHNRAIVDGLAAQDGLYTLAMLDERESFRVIGAVRETCMAQDTRFVEGLASARTGLVTLTITEKGYCLDSDGRLDFTHPDIAADLARPHCPASAMGWLVRGLQARKAARGGGLNILSCDNLSANGDTLRAAVLALAEQIDPDLRGWIDDEIRFPNSMVDCITPATNDALRARVREAGLADASPVQREAFASWVIQNSVASGFPDLASVGAVMARNVSAHEQAKLRMLNGAHSTLAYLGLAAGHATVAAAMADARIATLVETMMTEEIAPSLAPTPDLDLHDYLRTLLKRFRNPALYHQLSQIAWDGSQKLPIRLLGTVRDNLAAGRPVARLCVGVAAWIRFVRRTTSAGVTLVDPLADQLALLAARLHDDAEHDVDMFLGVRAMFSADLAQSALFRRALSEAYAAVIEFERQR